jgi:hypothetical protein
LARLLVKVLRGVKPEDIPVEEPAKFDLVVNLKTAKAIGLTGWVRKECETPRLRHGLHEEVLSFAIDLLARTHANDFRQLVHDPIYQATFPAMRLARDTDREMSAIVYSSPPR